MTSNTPKQSETHALATACSLSRCRRRSDVALVTRSLDTFPRPACESPSGPQICTIFWFVPVKYA
eukprot:252037-Pyramimonas_sp.AAC.1